MIYSYIFIYIHSDIDIPMDHQLIKSKYHYDYNKEHFFHRCFQLPHVFQNILHMKNG